ncbi:beta-ketoacyl synthase N-terminal-like domain-containing protein [Candidatus Thiosymbion oneisti]|uniref:beta-ketoacyl synthase N-terminal-like domain-containing protein n=1 Tax=Candidatus Thiosymbion oneisti TaxID=589554 RepID=UPI00105C6D70|nr:beta-ketoacyl synthase N-terminal-like domain-containing protein [Candidatus Thiosymbion oneisti]
MNKLPSPRIVITAAGAATPVGLTLAQTAAAVRAQIANFNEISWCDKEYEPFVIAYIPEECLPDLPSTLTASTQYSRRESRMLRAANLALQDLARAQPDLDAAIPLLLALPQDATTDHNELWNALLSLTSLPIDPEHSAIIPRGRAAGLIGVDEATKLLTQGTAEFVLVGGCDSEYDLERLGHLDRVGRLKSDINLDGFIPGEGAGFLLLSTERTAAKLGLTTLGVIAATARGFEHGHLHSETPYRGEGLSETWQALLGNLAGQREHKIATLYSSMNGESYWAKELGVCTIRHQDSLVEAPFISHPADCFGDLGAAFGPVMISLAATGLQRGYRRGPVLVYCSSDHGHRAAAILHKIQCH